MQCQVLSERRDQDGAGALLAGGHGSIGVVHLGIRASHLAHTLKALTEAATPAGPPVYVRLKLRILQVQQPPVGGQMMEANV